MSSCSRGNYNPRYSCCYEDAGSSEIQRKCTVGLWNDAAIPEQIRPKRIKTVSCTREQPSQGYKSSEWEYINSSLQERLMMTSSNGSISRVMALCAGNSPVTGEFPSQRPVTRSVDVFCDLPLNKRLRWRQWFETTLLSSWRHCDVDVAISTLVAVFVAREWLQIRRKPQGRWYIIFKLSRKAGILNQSMFVFSQDRHNKFTLFHDPRYHPTQQKACWSTRKECNN